MVKTLRLNTKTDGFFFGRCLSCTYFVCSEFYSPGKLNVIKSSEAYLKRLFIIISFYLIVLDEASANHFYSGFHVIGMAEKKLYIYNTSL